MSVLSITITNEIAPRAILALFDGITNDTFRCRLKGMERDMSTTPLRRSVFRH